LKIRLNITPLLALVAIGGFSCYFATVAAEFGGDFLLGMVLCILSVGTLLTSTTVLLLGAFGIIGRRK
jgi:hypothetical protein